MSYNSLFSYNYNLSYESDGSSGSPSNLYNSSNPYNNPYPYNGGVIKNLTLTTALKISAEVHKATILKGNVVGVKIGKQSNRLSLEKKTFDVQVTSNV